MPRGWKPKFTADGILRVGIAANLTAQRFGAFGLSLGAMRKYLIDFNNALRVSAPVMSQFGMSMEHVQFQSAALAKEFNVAPEKVLGLYNVLEKGFEVPPFDQLGDSLRVARAMFGYSEGAAEAFFQKMINVTKLGPQFEEFVNTFVKLKSLDLAKLAATGIDPGLAGDMEKAGEQALRIAYMQDKISRNEYTSRVALFRLGSQQTILDKRRAVLADKQAEGASRASVYQKIMLQTSEGAAKVMQLEATVIGKILDLSKENTFTEKEKLEIAEGLTEKFEQMEAAGLGKQANELKKQLEETLGIEVGKKDVMEQIQDMMEKRLASLADEGGAESEILTKQLAKMKALKAMDELMFMSKRQLKAIQKTHEAVSGELSTQLSLQGGINRLMSRVGSLGGTAYAGMVASYSEQIALQSEKIKLAEKEVAVTDAMVESMGQMSDISSGAGTMEEKLAASEELYQKMKGEKTSVEDLETLRKSINALANGDVKVQAELMAGAMKMKNEAREKLVTSHEEFDLSKQIADKYEFQKKTLTVMTTQASLQVQLADNLAKGVGASVEARLKEADALQAQSNILEKQKADIVESIAALRAKANQEGISQEERLQWEGEIADAGLVSKELDNERLDIQMKQVSALKSLRDGYIDAIGAMTTGAGVFNEIIVDENHNLGALMRTTEEAVASLRTGTASGAGAEKMQHGIGGFVRGRGPSGDYDILPKSVDDLIKQASATREALDKGGLVALGMSGINQRLVDVQATTGVGLEETVRKLEETNQILTGNNTYGGGGGSSGGGGGSSGGNTTKQSDLFRETSALIAASRATLDAAKADLAAKAGELAMLDQMQGDGGVTSEDFAATFDALITVMKERGESAKDIADFQSRYGGMFNESRVEKIDDPTATTATAADAANAVLLRAQLVSMEQGDAMLGKMLGEQGHWGVTSEDFVATFDALIANMKERGASAESIEDVQSKYGGMFNESRGKIDDTPIADVRSRNYEAMVAAIKNNIAGARAVDNDPLADDSAKYWEELLRVTQEQEVMRINLSEQAKLSDDQRNALLKEQLEERKRMNAIETTAGIEEAGKFRWTDMLPDSWTKSSAPPVPPVGAVQAAVNPADLKAGSKDLAKEIAKLVKKAVVEAQRRLVEDGFISS